MDWEHPRHWHQAACNTTESPGLLQNLCLTTQLTIHPYPFYPWFGSSKLLFICLYSSAMQSHVAQLVYTINTFLLPLTKACHRFCISAWLLDPLLKLTQNKANILYLLRFFHVRHRSHRDQYPLSVFAQTTPHNEVMLVVHNSRRHLWRKRPISVTGEPCFQNDECSLWCLRFIFKITFMSTYFWVHPPQG